MCPDSPLSWCVSVVLVFFVSGCSSAVSGGHTHMGVHLGGEDEAAACILYNYLCGLHDGNARTSVE
jgi:hypothetical protein